jgi:hypothetical protein
MGLCEEVSTTLSARLNAQISILIDLNREGLVILILKELRESMEIKTLQQETALKEYETIDEEFLLDFEEWYRYWCYENGLFYDR